MRIPLEALAHFPSGRNAQETRRAEPIEASTDLGDAPQFSLNQWSPDAPQNHQPSGERRQISNGLGQLPPPSDEQRLRINGQPVFEERRRAERRQRNEPVLLDTRLTLYRRKSDRPSGISLKI